MTGIEILGAGALLGDIGIGTVTLAEVLTGVGAAVGAAGAISSAQASANAAEFNAEQAQRDAEQERLIARQEAADERRDKSRLLAASRARRAGSGVTGEGTPLLMDVATAAEIELNAQRILTGGENRALRFESEAALQRSKAKGSRTSGYFGAGTTLLTGLGTAAFG